MTKLTFCLLMMTLCASSELKAQELSIGEVQGISLSSPFVNQQVTIQDAVITFRGSDFFVIQSAKGRSDGNPLTSDALYVTEGTNLEVGTSIVISGEIEEQFGRTRLNSPTIESIDQDPLEAPMAVRLESFFETQEQWEKLDIEPLEYMLVDFQEGKVGGAAEFEGDLWLYFTEKRPVREPGLSEDMVNGIPI